MALVIAHAELVSDQTSDPRTAPQRRREAVRLGAFQQQRLEAFELRGVQQRLTAGAAGLAQPGFAVTPVSSQPLADALPRDLQSPRCLGLTTALLDQPDRFETALLQGLEIPPYAFCISHTYKDLRTPKRCHFILRDSIVSPRKQPVFFAGDALEILKSWRDDSIDCAMTSPPYWGQRKYKAEGIGLEADPADYVRNLVRILAQVRRVLKPSGSLWLNIGDAYRKKSLLGIPWRVVLELIDTQGWLLRNNVVWHKVKGGPDPTRNKLRNVHEPLFHLVKSPEYYYDIDSIRSRPQSAKVVNGRVVSATGVSGVRYRRQIELSTALSEVEKRAAIEGLEAMLDEVRGGRLADFRMIIRAQQRTTHSDSEAVSGRAGEIAAKGFYFLRYNPKGSKPKDVWDILPEDTQGRQGHYAPYPEDLCKLPILATCPPRGVVLDPFCGTGTTMLAAYRLGRKSVGIDVSAQYLETARERCSWSLTSKRG